MHKTGISEWEDWVEKKVTVRPAMGEQTIFHGIHCGFKHISRVTCISAGGGYRIPFLVSS
jgi:hypothetical protein